MDFNLKTCLVLLFFVLYIYLCKGQSRIIGGTKVDIKTAPYIVNLRTNYTTPICGAVVISRRYVLTAAHCPRNEAVNKLTILAGSSKLSWRDTLLSGAQIRKIKCVYEHPNYNHETSENDISILEVFPPLMFSNRVSSIKLAAESDMPADNEPASIYGWGSVDVAVEEVVNELHMAFVDIVNIDVCKINYAPYVVNSNNMICAAAPGVDSCVGDSGGPLVTKACKLAGLTSWGFGCADPNYPGVYTRIPGVSDFIKDITGISP